MPSLVSGNRLLDRERKQMRGGVAVNFQRFGIFGGEDLQRGVVFERPRKVVKVAIDARDYGIVGEPGADDLATSSGVVPAATCCWIRRAG